MWSVFTEKEQLVESGEASGEAQWLFVWNTVSAKLWLLALQWGPALRQSHWGALDKPLHLISSDYLRTVLLSFIPNPRKHRPDLPFLVRIMGLSLLIRTKENKKRNNIYQKR